MRTRTVVFLLEPTVSVMKGITELKHLRTNDVAPPRLMAWALRQMTLRKGQSGASSGYSTVLRVWWWKRSVLVGAQQKCAFFFWISSRNILLVPCMFDCLKQDCQRFTPGALAPTYWVTSFMTAVLEAKRASKHCSRHTAFLPSAASMQIRALEQFSFPSLRLLLLATLCKNEEDGVASD